MNKKKQDWSSFKKRIVIEKPVHEVYAAWSEAGKIEQWFLEEAKYSDSGGQYRKPVEPFQKGDRFTWKWHNWDFREEGEILKANGNDRISFTFGVGGIVHVDLKSQNNHTEIVLTQEEIPTDEQGKMNYYVGCATGWTFWLANLKAWLEYGITLHATGLSQNETSNLVNS